MRTRLQGFALVASFLMPTLSRVVTLWARVAACFVAATLVWCLLVAGFGVAPGSAALVGLAAAIAFSAAMAPIVGCIALGDARGAVLWMTPLAALPAAFAGLYGFHALLQGLAAAFPSALPGVIPRAEAGGSVVVWAVLATAMLLVARSARASGVLRTLAALACAGLAVGLGLWVRALGV